MISPRKLFSITLALVLTSATQTYAGVYDTLEFGDSKADVKSKLHASKLVTIEESDSIFGVLGLSGIFKCNHKLADLSYSLHFAWKKNELSEVILKSDPVKQAQYYAELEPAWEKGIKLLDQAYGPAQSTNDFPSQFKHSSDGMIFSHLWSVDDSTSVMIGTGVIQNRYFLAIRYLEPSAIKKLKKTKTK